MFDNSKKLLAELILEFRNTKEFQPIFDEIEQLKKIRLLEECANNESFIKKIAGPTGIKSLQEFHMAVQNEYKQQINSASFKEKCAQIDLEVKKNAVAQEVQKIVNAEADKFYSLSATEQTNYREKLKKKYESSINVKEACEQHKDALHQETLSAIIRKNIKEELLQLAAGYLQKKPADDLFKAWPEHNELPTKRFEELNSLIAVRAVWNIAIRVQKILHTPVLQLPNLKKNLNKHKAFIDKNKLALGTQVPKVIDKTSLCLANILIKSFEKITNPKEFYNSILETSEEEFISYIHITPILLKTQVLFYYLNGIIRYNANLLNESSNEEKSTSEIRSNSLQKMTNCSKAIINTEKLHSDIDTKLSEIKAAANEVQITLGKENEKIQKLLGTSSLTSDISEEIKEKYQKLRITVDSLSALATNLENNASELQEKKNILNDQLKDLQKKHQQFSEMSTLKPFSQTASGSNTSSPRATLSAHKSLDLISNNTEQQTYEENLKQLQQLSNTLSEYKIILEKLESTVYSNELRALLPAEIEEKTPTLKEHTQIDVLINQLINKPHISSKIDFKQLASTLNCSEKDPDLISAKEKAGRWQFKRHSKKINELKEKLVARLNKQRELIKAENLQLTQAYEAKIQQRLIEENERVANAEKLKLELNEMKIKNANAEAEFKSIQSKCDAFLNAKKLSETLQQLNMHSTDIEIQLTELDQLIVESAKVLAHINLQIKLADRPEALAETRNTLTLQSLKVDDITRELNSLEKNTAQLMKSAAEIASKHLSDKQSKILTHLNKKISTLQTSLHTLQKNKARFVEGIKLAEENFKSAQLRLQPSGEEKTATKYMRSSSATSLNSPPTFFYQKKLSMDVTIDKQNLLKNFYQVNGGGFFGRYYDARSKKYCVKDFCSRIGELFFSCLGYKSAEQTRHVFIFEKLYPALNKYAKNESSKEELIAIINQGIDRFKPRSANSKESLKYHLENLKNHILGKAPADNNMEIEMSANLRQPLL